MLKQEPGVCSLSGLIWAKSDSVAQIEQSVCVCVHRCMHTLMFVCVKLDRQMSTKMLCWWDLDYLRALVGFVCGGATRAAKGCTGDFTWVHLYRKALSVKNNSSGLWHTSAGRAPVRLASYLSTATLYAPHQTDSAPYFFSRAFP